VIRPTAELPQRLQEWQVRFPFAVVLDALAPGSSRPPLPGGQASQPLLAQRRLAYPGFATNEDGLTGALSRMLEPGLQGLDFPLTSDEGSGQQRRGDLPVVADEKAIALSSHRFEIPRCHR
jgi:hypothetical protein